MTLELNGDHITEPTVIANKINEFYKTTPEKLARFYDQLAYSFPGRSDVDSIFLYPIKQNEFLRTVWNLK